VTVNEIPPRDQPLPLRLGRRQTKKGLPEAPPSAGVAQVSRLKSAPSSRERDVGLDVDKVITAYVIIALRSTCIIHAVLGRTLPGVVAFFPVISRLWQFFPVSEARNSRLRCRQCAIAAILNNRLRKHYSLRARRSCAPMRFLREFSRRTGKDAGSPLAAKGSAGGAPFATG
jgi:hypothetical protein